MANVEEIIDLIKTSPLSEKEIGDIMAICVTVTFANSFMSLGLDLMQTPGPADEPSTQDLLEDNGFTRDGAVAELCPANKKSHAEGMQWVCVRDTHGPEVAHRWRVFKSAER